MTHRDPNSRPPWTAVHGRTAARHVRCLVIGGVTLAPQGFASREDVDLFAECAELNRRAILPSPETLFGKSVKQIAADARW